MKNIANVRILVPALTAYNKIHKPEKQDIASQPIMIIFPKIFYYHGQKVVLMVKMSKFFLPVCHLWHPMFDIEMSKLLR